MEWKFIKPLKRHKGKLITIPLDYADYQIPVDYIPTKYFDVYNIFFKFENALRIFVYFVLKSYYGKDWVNFQIGNKPDSTILTIFKERSGRPKKYAYIGFKSENPIMYISLDELVRIMIKKREYFNRYFLGSLEVLKEKFNELVITRNNLAHYREITKKDVERIKIIIDDLSPSILPFFRDLFYVDESFTKIDFKENDELFKRWQFLINNCRKSRLYLLSNKKGTQIKLAIRIPTEVIKIKKSDLLEIYDILDFPYVIIYVSVDFIKLYNKIKEFLPYIIYFDYDEISLLKRKKNNKLTGEMSDFDIFFHFDLYQFNKNYERFFIILKDILDEIEKDFNSLNEKNFDKLRILKKYECHISEDLEYESGFNLPENIYIEDWKNVEFGGMDILDFQRFPWIKEKIGYLGL